MLSKIVKSGKQENIFIFEPAKYYKLQIILAISKMLRFNERNR